MNFEKIKADLKNVFSDEKTTEDFRVELQNSPIEWFDEKGRVRCVADDTGEEFFVSPNESLRVLSIVVQLDLHPAVAGAHVRVFAAIGGIFVSEEEKAWLVCLCALFCKNVL